MGLAKHGKGFPPPTLKRDERKVCAQHRPLPLFDLHVSLASDARKPEALEEGMQLGSKVMSPPSSSAISQRCKQVIVGENIAVENHVQSP